MLVDRLTMAGETKIEDESGHQTPTHDQPFPTSPQSIPKANKSKLSHEKDKGSPASASASASAKRRCVSTACIACRRRKSKVSFCPTYPTLHYRARADQGISLTSVMGIHQAVLPAPPSTEPNVSTTQTQIIVAKAYTRKTSTTSRRAIPPYKLSSRLFSTTLKMRSRIW